MAFSHRFPNFARRSQTPKEASEQRLAQSEYLSNLFDILSGVALRVQVELYRTDGVTLRDGVSPTLGERFAKLVESATISAPARVSPFFFTESPPA